MATVNQSLYYKSVSSLANSIVSGILKTNSKENHSLCYEVPDVTDNGVTNHILDSV